MAMRSTPKHQQQANDLIHGRVYFVLDERRVAVGPLVVQESCRRLVLSSILILPPFLLSGVVCAIIHYSVDPPSCIHSGR
jgi:hypothetical protein